MKAQEQKNPSPDHVQISNGRQVGQFDLDSVLAQARAEVDRTAAVGPDMSWEVFPPHEDATEAYRVDLGRLAHGAKHPQPVVAHLRQARTTRVIPMRRVVSNAEMTRFLAPAIKKWSLDKSKRTAAECLSLLKYFYQFYGQLQSQVGIAPPPVSEKPVEALGVAIGIAFADWLRRLKVSSSRRSACYAFSKQLLEEAVGHTIWRSNPFRADARADAEADEAVSPLSTEQFRALLQMCRGVVDSFHADRRAAAGRIRASPESSDPSRFSIQQTIKQGEVGLNADQAKHAALIFGSEDFACASFVLSLIRLGCNEQPLLDAKGAWHAPSPFDSSQRIVYLWKKRAASRRAHGDVKPPKPKKITLTSAVRPRHHPYRLMRNYQRLTRFLRPYLLNLAAHESDKGRASHLNRLALRFWVFVSASGEIGCLDPTGLSRRMNDFLERHESAFPALRSNGELPRYSSRTLRDAYLEFVQRFTRFDVEAGQIALSHSEGSNAIVNYLRKTWARKYVRDEHRLLQTEIVRQLSDPDWELSPMALRGAINGARGVERDLRPPLVVRPHLKAAQVRDGLFCVDQFHPPAHVHKPKREGEACPGDRCLEDCEWARLYDASFPLMAQSILQLRLQRESGGMHLWEGSEAAKRLHLLEDLLARIPEAKRSAAMQTAATSSAPVLFFKVRP